MIEVVVKQEILLNKSIPSAMQKDLAENIIQKISKAHYRYGGFDKTGEFTLGKHEGENIVFLIKQRHSKMNKPVPVPWKSQLAEPMRRALKGEKGAAVAYDYRGELVLAAYEPIKDMGWGIVAKLDLSEIRAPYIKAAEYAIGLTLLLALTGSLIFWYFLHVLVQTIEDSRHFNRMLIASSSIGMALCSLEGKIIDANKSFLKIISLSSKRLRELSYFDCVAEDSVKFEKKQFQSLIQNNHIDPYESVYIGKEGERIPVKISGKLIIIKGQPYVWLSVDNIKEYKRREAELLLSDAVFHNTSEVIFITDTSKNIIKINEAFTAVTGFSEEEVLGKNPRILKSGKHDSKFYEEMFHTINTTGKWRGEIWNKRKNGELYPSLQSISAIRGKSGKLIRYVAVLSDISVQKAYEQQLILESIKSKEDAIVVAKALLDKTKQPIVIENCNLTSSISIGIAFYPQNGADSSTLLKSADKAMYHAKHHTKEHYSAIN